MANTAGHKKGTPMGNAYLALLAYTFGELCALPSVAFIGVKVLGAYGSSASVGGHAQARLKEGGELAVLRQIAGMYRALKTGELLWGVTCGVLVSTGYLCYLLALNVLPSTTIFPIVACNSLISLLAEVVKGEFRAASCRKLAFLIASVGLYGSAVGLLASI